MFAMWFREITKIDDTRLRPNALLANITYKQSAQFIITCTL